MSKLLIQSKAKKPNKTQNNKGLLGRISREPRGDVLRLEGPGQLMQASLLCRNRHRPCPLHQRGKERGQAARRRVLANSFLTGQRALVGSRKRERLCGAGGNRHLSPWGLSSSMRTRVPCVLAWPAHHSIVIVVGGRQLGSEVGLEHTGQQSPEPTAWCVTPGGFCYGESVTV